MTTLTARKVASAVRRLIEAAIRAHEAHESPMNRDGTTPRDQARAGLEAAEASLREALEGE